MIFGLRILIFYILISRREWVGKPNQSIFPVAMVQLSPKFFHIAIMSLPTYHAKNIDIDSPFVCFLVHMHSFRYHLWQKFPVSAGYSEMPIAILSSRLRKVKRIVVRGHT